MVGGRRRAAGRPDRVRAADPRQVFEIEAIPDIRRQVADLAKRLLA